ncbi:MAG TPA: hypothetical protein V6C58_01870, partial [Allocoleopsis sp.]
LNIKIYSNALSLSNFDSNSLNTLNLLQVIPVTAPLFGLIQYVNINPSNKFKIYNTSSVSLLDIKFLDDNGDYINFNNIPWSICLLITYTRLRINPQKTNFYSVIKPMTKQLQQDIPEEDPNSDIKSSELGNKYL